MPQFLRPSSDISAGAWTTAPLFSKINESSSNDSPFIESPTGSNTTCDLGLSSANNPDTGTRTLRIRVRKGASGGNTRGLNYNLKQGSTSVQSGTVEATLTETFTTFSITITGTITDYSDLSLELISTGTVTGAGTARRTVEVSWAEFEIPDQTVTNSEITGAVSIPQITSTGSLTNVVPQFNLSGDALIGTVQSSASLTFEGVVIEEYQITGDLTIPNLTSTGSVFNGEVSDETFDDTFDDTFTEGGADTFNITGALTIGQITSTASLESTVPIYEIDGAIEITPITSTASLESTVPIYEIDGAIEITPITSEASISFGEPVYTITGGVTIGQITSNGTLATTVPVYEINGAVEIPPITSTASLSFGEVVFSITGALEIPAITSTASLESTVPTSNINGAIEIGQITTDGAIQNDVPFSLISGELTIPLITSNASLSSSESFIFINRFKGRMRKRFKPH